MGWCVMPDKPCVCGEPTALGTVHRRDGPCFTYESDAAKMAGYQHAIDDLRASRSRVQARIETINDICEDAGVFGLGEKAEDRVHALVRLLDRHREALRPFATYAHHSQQRMDGRMLSRRLMPDEPGYLDGSEIGVTANDFAVARAVLFGASNE